MSCMDGHCGELTINENLITSQSKSLVARVGKNKECIVQKYSAKNMEAYQIFIFLMEKRKVIQIKIN